MPRLQQPAPFEFVTEAQFDDTIAINFRGAFFTIQKALPLLSSSASIIVTTSITNKMGSPNFSVYAACKAALHSWCRHLVWNDCQGIRINAISPGPIETPMFTVSVCRTKRRTRLKARSNVNHRSSALAHLKRWHAWHYFSPRTMPPMLLGTSWWLMVL